MSSFGAALRGLEAFCCVCLEALVTSRVDWFVHVSGAPPINDHIFHREAEQGAAGSCVGILRGDQSYQLCTFGDRVPPQVVSVWFLNCFFLSSH